MSEPRNELQRINWSQCFPFTRLFGSFKLAIHPSKLGLALAAVLLTLIWGGFLDFVWPSECQPIGPEVNTFWQVSDIDAWREEARSAAAQDIRRVCQTIGMSKKLPVNLEKKLAEDPADVIDDVLDEVQEQYEKKIDKLDEKLEDQDEDDEGALDEDTEKAAIGNTYRDAYHTIRSRAPQGVFKSFLKYQTTVGTQALESACGLNFARGLTGVITTRNSPLALEARLQTMRLNQPEGLIEIRSGMQGFGVLSCVVLSIRGWQWMVYEHFWFLLFFALPTLGIWSLFGGAICRITALNVARDERISPTIALDFASRKIVSFFIAPLFPVLLIAGVGICLLLGGLVTSIPGIGELIGGVGMGLALLGGFVIALAVTGAVCGGWLMWPTIAVEGSDSFDAFSRSYNYVFARPWRTAFYVAVATVYGAITYLFARFFILVALKASRWFVGLGLSGTDRTGIGDSGATKIDTLWPMPGWDNLKPASMPIGMEGWDAAGTFLICIWITIAAALLCAFLASFFLSASTVIYYLLRREVDATDIEDIYLEEDESNEMLYDATAAVESEVGTTEVGPDPEPEATTEPEKPSAAESTDDEEDNE